MPKHPHEGGEIFLFSDSESYFQETPPRRWGNPLGRDIETRLLRNTPTKVGKSNIAGNVTGRRLKHPHEGGEIIARIQLDHSDRETPPRRWGNRQLS